MRTDKIFCRLIDLNKYVILLSFDAVKYSVKQDGGGGEGANFELE